MSATTAAVFRIAEEMRAAIAAPKCHPCACFHGALRQLAEALPAVSPADHEALRPVLETGEQCTLPEEYDCLGCPTCWPAQALNVAADAFPDAAPRLGAQCPTDAPASTRSWPPLPGDYRVLDQGADIAVCTLTSTALSKALATARPRRVAIIGTLCTENLGIERIITNILASPNITSLLLCGGDSAQRIGHLPGQTLLSLAAHGIDDAGRIVGSQGRRPILKNLPRAAIETFRREIAVLDQLGEEHLPAILEAIAAVPRSSRSRQWLLESGRAPAVLLAEDAPHLTLDPGGYFIVFPDRHRKLVLVEHYANDGTLAHVVQGTRTEDLCAALVSRGLVTRLDHAAYLGKELARAEHALQTGEAYVQSAAPEPTDGCGCNTP